ncbi:type III secretion system needle length determinant [Aeromonas finlandensis]|uniref:type III secretion system needle length determinant n=1 Tax=Aeromonas finlandensis TaxID=1543375 RepID=UPI00051C3583
MNRVMSSKGTTRSQGDPPQAEANPTQQQRFEQAMRLEQEQHGQLRQRKQAVQNKSARDAALQHERMASDTQQQARLKPPAIKGDQPEPSAISPATQRARERQEESEKTEQQAEIPALTAQAHLAAEGSPPPAQDHARLTPTNKEADAGRPHAPHTAADQPVAQRELAGGKPTRESGDGQLADAGQPHALQTATDQPVAKPELAGGNSPHASGDLLQADARELAERLASGTDTDALTVTDEVPEASGQPLPPQVKTPGDLLLARMAPAEHPRELGQLLERLAVDIYQELGRPERPPLLRLTLPQLGDLAIRIAHQGGELQIEILATREGELLLNQGRSDLVDRLQRLYPGERVALDLFSQADSEQGSRHKRSIYEEWDADA